MGTEGFLTLAASISGAQNYGVELNWIEFNGMVWISRDTDSWLALSAVQISYASE